MCCLCTNVWGNFGQSKLEGAGGDNSLHWVTGLQFALSHWATACTESEFQEWSFAGPTVGDVTDKLYSHGAVCSDYQATSSRRASWMQNRRRRLHSSSSHNSSTQRQVGCHPVLDRHCLQLSSRWHQEVEVAATHRCTHLSRHQLVLPTDFRVGMLVCVPLVTAVCSFMWI